MFDWTFNEIIDLIKAEAYEVTTIFTFIEKSQSLLLITKLNTFSLRAISSYNFREITRIFVKPLRIFHLMVLFFVLFYHKD